MAKFDFNNSRYAQLFSDQTIMKVLFEDGVSLQNNFRFWTTQFEVDPMSVPVSPKGESTFSIASVKREQAPMPDIVSPLAGGKPIDEEGVDIYTASIPILAAPVVLEQAAERDYKRAIYEQYGSDTQLIMSFIGGVQKMLDSMNQGLSNMSAQLLSTGEINYTYGRGIKAYLQKAPIPEENFMKAGEKAWTDTSCKILTQMAKIERDFRDSTGYSAPMKWQIPYDIFHDTFMQNEEVKNWVKDVKAVGGILVSDAIASLESEVISAMNKYDAISPIEIVREKQKDYSGMIQGWKDGVVVLRPAGFAGMIKHADLLDVQMATNYGSSVVNKVFTQVGDGGLFTLINTTSNNGDYKEWKTELKASAVPALYEFNYHVIVDTKTAEE